MKDQNSKKTIAAFISPHGFGHATRATAVLESLQSKDPSVKLKLFTTVPEHIFSDSLTNYTLSRVLTDIGIVQQNALHCDVDATHAALKNFIPFEKSLLTELSGQVAGCSAVLCDISPLGITVAKHACLPSVLVENFTWDWIYAPHSGLRDYADMMRDIFAQATIHIQTEPVCSNSDRSLKCPPIFRKIRRRPSWVRQRLHCDDRRMVLISMGGIGYNMDLKNILGKFPEIIFVVAGTETTGPLSENCYGIAHKSDVYHPDLIHAADLVVCKAGYSTVAECYQAGTSILCVDRQGFAETSVLSSFVEKQLQGTVIGEEDILSGSWADLLPGLLDAPSPDPAMQNGAEMVADVLIQQ